MDEHDAFLTVRTDGVSTFVEKGSRFLGFVFQVQTEEQVRARLAALQLAHPSASHHCYAWRLGADLSRYRSSDAGEPAGTAGKPIFERIRALALTNVLVVVVRYFGGTLLGTHGLIASYREAAARALENAGVQEKHIMCECIVRCGHESLGNVLAKLRQAGARISLMDYDSAHRIVFCARRQHVEALAPGLRSMRSVIISISHKFEE